MVPGDLPVSCRQACLHDLLSANKRSARDGLLASRHRRPAFFLNQIASFVAVGLFQRGKLCDRIGTILESADASRCSWPCGPPTH